MDEKLKIIQINEMINQMDRENITFKYNNIII